MITIRDYAKSKHVSYEAVRKQVSNLARTELAGHLHKQNRTQYLDDEAVKILDQHRQESIIIVQHEAATEEMERLKDQVTTLQAQIMEAQQKIIDAKQQVIDVQAERATLIEYKAKYENMIEYKDNTAKALQEAQEKAAAAEREVNSFKKTVLGLYRKEK